MNGFGDGTIAMEVDDDRTNDDSRTDREVD